MYGYYYYMYYNALLNRDKNMEYSTLNTKKDLSFLPYSFHSYREIRSFHESISISNKKGTSIHKFLRLEEQRK